MKASLSFSLLAVLGRVCARRHACSPDLHQSYRHGDGPSVYDLKTSETSAHNLPAGQSSTFSTIVSISSSTATPVLAQINLTSHSSQALSTVPLSSNTSLTSASVISKFSTPSTQNLSSVAFPTTMVSSLASSTSASGLAAPTSTGPVLAPASFNHPGLLQTDKDFARIRSKLAAGEEPWTTAWNKLLESSYASSSYVPNPVAIVYRGYDGTNAENYGQLYGDVAAAYVLAIRWAITQESEFGDAALRIMDAWSSTLTALSGTVDLYLAAGIYGYEFAQAGEIMRDYDGWSTEKFQQFKDMMTNVFYKPVDGWFTGHENWASYAPGVYANWDLSLIASAMSIGVLADDPAIYNQGISWFYNGTGNGQINEAVPFTHFYDNQLLGQTMESGRDQGHNTLNMALLGVIGQTAYNQGNDLFAYNGSIILAASEYVARYNLGYDVPYTPYDNGWIDMPTISNSSRGSIRPNWELLYNHYGVLKNENVTWTKQFRDLVVSDNGGAEGGSGDYGPNSGGYDQLGWGTLLYTLK